MTSHILQMCNITIYLPDQFDAYQIAFLQLMYMLKYAQIEKSLQCLISFNDPENPLEQNN